MANWSRGACSICRFDGAAAESGKNPGGFAGAAGVIRQAALKNTMKKGFRIHLRAFSRMFYQLFANMLERQTLGTGASSAIEGPQ
jgi:hypothetical protein